VIYGATTAQQQQVATHNPFANLKALLNKE
jgi:hypothetical protein